MRNNTKPRPSPFKRLVCFPVLLAVLSLAAVEFCLQVARLFIDAGKLPNRQYLLSPYRGEEWAKPLFRESLASRSQFDPFLGFRERPQTGTYVNIDRQGFRATWNPPLRPGTAAPLVLVFGGSTVWGWGARDDYTIPSCLSRSLADGSAPSRVTNCGQRGYTVTQEILQLTRLLRQGVRPRVVVFYDGFNDVFFSYRAGQADTPYNLAEHKERFEAGDLEMVGLGLTHWVETHSLVLSVAGKIAARLNPGERTRYGTRAPRYTDAELAGLAAQIADSYAASLDLLGHLAKAYGFRLECFWQPVIFYETALTQEEVQIGPAAGDEQLGRLFVLVRRNLCARSLQHFHDISDTYRGRQTTIYIDFAHVSEAGNRLVAARMGDTLLKEGDLEQVGDRP